MTKQRLQLTWYNKDKALIPTEAGKYGYTWVDPSDPRYCETHTLVYDDYVQGSQTEKSEEFDYSERADLEPQDENLLILGESGDVLESLTRVPELAEKYVGKVKLIYIDPPFNTAQTFASYEDNLEHSIWLTMMRDRLLHMKKLLADDGSIWVHLDDVEVHRMRVLMDEVFGAGNFQAEIVWQKADSPRRGLGFSVDQDFVIVYRRSEAFEPNKALRTAADNARFSNPDNDPLGPWWDDNPSGNHGDGSGGMCYAIQNPLTGEMMRPPKGASWRYSQQRILDGLQGWVPYRLENLHDADWRASNEGVPRDKASDDVCALVLDVPLDEARKRVAARRISGDPLPEILIRSTGGIGRKAYIPTKGNNPRTWWENKDVGHNRAAKSELKALFPALTPFDTPKPERLLERIIHIGSNPGDIVLDVFAGSGTTAAVAQKMGRRWVTCELLESTFTTFTRPRLEKVVNDEDPGGITRTKGERVAAYDVELPDGVSPEDAAKFTRVLNKLIKDDPEAKKNPLTKALKAASKTRRTKEVLNWRGGGGFQVAHLSPACFDYNPELDRVMLTAAATGEALIQSVAANLGFTLLHADDDYIFDARRGNALLKVVEGVATVEIVDWLASQTQPGETIVLAATTVMDGVREHLRKTVKGSRVVALPDDLFRYSKGDEQ
ncbi:site-specific DNA-methyltransferase [Corynebacterium urealyticum]|uniref:Putative DNA restriction-modification system, DNA methylase n=1 Tax=Corynebacterium urealyticum (strain ATCC 43042 / DSM 7109) TaxID=504474 RepID=B1VHV5_CORU7|nr:site-specific DNA-methyltransferase [Corynebacterium urealyticum]CAQ05755.1 putative DNA restriction-modification system, DNA methylase [Corynebacterium urealyticum DSM 7109]SNV91096.1 DNA restriction-modification system, DNA methylase [Corynebacterium urealyticum]